MIAAGLIAFADYEGLYTAAALAFLTATLLFCALSRIRNVRAAADAPVGDST